MAALANDEHQQAYEIARKTFAMIKSRPCYFRDSVISQLVGMMEFSNRKDGCACQDNCCPHCDELDCECDDEEDEFKEGIKN